uniref:Peptidase S1 domain-containing protein n=1 Tax=Panagrolaimus sp. PS1159 TaxID=55785 RepID=A0AC35FS97_9BILA
MLKNVSLKKYGSLNNEKTLEGSASKLGDWPWIVSLAKIGCTATIIGEKWILTAAHCVSNNVGVIIYANTVERTKGKNITVEKVFVHPKWNLSTISDDLALIKCIPKKKFVHAWYGDSGGPLMQIYKGRFYEVGITSWGSTKDQKPVSNHSDLEDIFTLVPAYCDWIAEATNGDVKCE